MNESYMNELEGAARVIMAAPNSVTVEERRKAEEIILNFRTTKTPIRTCRQILENSSVDYLHFEAAEVIKKGIIREWNFVSFSDKQDLVQYLFRYICARDIPCFVRDRILIVISIMVKRISADDNGKLRHSLLNQVEDLINCAENPKKILGCQLISILMDEYATTCKSSDIGLQWEVHNNCKRQFESTDLIRIFKYVMGLLKDIEGIETPFEPNTANFIRCLLQIAEKVLVWSYNTLIAPKRIIRQFESTREVEDYPLLYFTMEWKDVFLAPELLPLMFMVYWKVRYMEELSHHALTCLVQLASVTAKGMEERRVFDQEARVAYVRRYIENFSKLVSSVNFEGKDALGISSIARKLCFCYHFEIVNGLTREEVKTFIDELSTLSCTFCEKSASDESDDNVYEDSFRNMITVWSYLFNDLDKKPKLHVLSFCSRKVFSKFVQSIISPPYGFRRKNDLNEVIDNENDEDSDRIKYSDQLQVMGIFGRYILEISLPVVFKFLEHGTQTLRCMLHVMEHRTLTLDESTEIDSVFENIHWVLLLAGHLLAVDSDGETPSIPSEILTFLQNDKMQTLEATVETLLNSGDVDYENRRMQQCNEVVRVLAAALRLCKIEDMAASMKLGHFMSPLVSCSLMWFINRFCTHYLMPPDSSNVQPNSVLMLTLGKQTLGAHYVISVLMSKITNNILNFHTEPVLLKDTVDLFVDVISIKNKSQHVMNPDIIWGLINKQIDIKPDFLPPGIRRGLYRGFSLASLTFCQQDTAMMAKFMDDICQPLNRRFEILLLNDSFLNIHDEKAQIEVVDLMECVVGLAKGAALRSSQEIFKNIYPIIDAMVRMFKLYYNYQVVVQAVMELLCQSAKSLVCYLQQDQARTMFEYSVYFMTQYAECHSNRTTLETSAEDFMAQDLSYLLDILAYLLSKDYLDFCPSENVENTHKASNFVMRGFCIIMPLLTQNLLKYPNLCMQYYRVLTHINDMCPKEICSLENDALIRILQSIEIGLSQFRPEITHVCLDFISRVCGYIFKHKMDQSRIYEMLRPCVKLLLDLTLSNQIDADLLSTVGEAVYLLICCYPKEYEVCVQMLVQGQADPMVSERLSTSFDRMVVGIDFDNERISRVKFKTNFEKFVFHVQGFLMVK